MSVGEVSNPSLNGQLHYPPPADIDRPLNEAAADKIRDYRADDNNRPANAISFVPFVAITSGRLHCELVHFIFTVSSGNRPLLCYSGVQLACASKPSVPPPSHGVLPVKA